jgi:hypothetical protein
MRNARLFLMALLLSTQAAPAARTSTVQMRWDDAIHLVRGRTAEIVTASGAKRKGRVAAADAGSISLEAPGAPIARTDVAEIRLVQYLGNGRSIGKKLGGAVGLLGGVIAAVAVGMNETSSHKDRDKAVAALCIAGGLPGGLAGGYFLGRLADKETTVIRIIPQ